AGTRAMSLSEGVPQGGPPMLEAAAQLESLKLVCIQPAGGCCVAVQEVSTGIFEMAPEANCTTNWPITLAGWASLFVAARASKFVPGSRRVVTLICAVASQRNARLVAACPFTYTPQL